MIFIFKFLLLVPLVLFSCGNASIQKENLDKGKANDFIPTNEWQKVADDQAIPPGLHVKMDLSTGGKWAKLMENDNDNKNDVALTLSPNKETATVPLEKATDNKASYKINELKEALKKFKVEKNENESGEVVKSNYRSMDEIREAFEQFDLHEESDVQVMKRLVSILKNENSSSSVKLLALKDLEYYVHQIDNANDLVTFGGFSVVVQILNNTDFSLREEAAHVIGSAMQSNPKVQIESLRSGVLQTLLLMLGSTNYPMALRKKCLFAISSMVRHFPLAQIHLVQYGGLQIMVDLFSQSNCELLQIKAIRLVNDLIAERLTTEQDSSDPQQAEKLKQYRRVNLESLVKTFGWCSAISSSLRHSQHGWRESVMKAMKTVHGLCQNQFGEKSVINTLIQYQMEYKDLSVRDVAEGDSDSYFSSMYQLSNELLSLTQFKIRSEL